MKYTCEICNYKSNDKSNYNRHLKSVNHIKLCPKFNKLKCLNCNKEYTHKQSLSRHKKTCNDKDISEKFNEILSKLEEQSKEITDLKQLLS